jgi:arsenite methyltransferase
VACIADARPVSRYTDILAAAGLRTVRVERHDDALARMIDQIEARLAMLQMTAAGRLTAAGVNVDAVLHYTALARQAAAGGLLGYALLVAERPA